MSRISKGKVFIPKAWRPPELPGIPNPPLADVTPATTVPQRLLSDTGSGDSSASEESGSERTAKREDAGLLRRLPVSFPRACFVTRGLSAVAELAYVINAVRKNKSRKAVVERFIKENIQVVRFQFELDDEGNVMYLGPELHRAWDLYALFALVPSSASLDILIESLRKDNARWQDDVEGNGLRKAFRPRPINFDLFSEMLYDIIILHPNHFLPHRRPLPIFDSNTNQWLLYTSCDMALCDPSGTALPPFRDPNSGVRVQPINPLLLTINAHLKFQDHKTLFAYTFPTRTIQVMDKIATLAELIYFSPTPTEGSMGARTDIVLEAEEREQKNLDNAATPPQTSSRAVRTRTRNPLSSNSSSNNDRDAAIASTDTEAPANSVLSLTSENLTKLDAAQEQEELEQVEKILNDPLASVEERMVLSAWLFNPNASPHPPFTSRLGR